MTSLVRFGSIQDQFGGAMVRILVRPNKPDTPAKRTTMARLGIYRIQIRQ